MQDFSRFVGPLTKLTRKREKHAWTEDCDAAFEELKNILISASILKIRTEMGGMVIYSIGVYVMHLEHVIVYASRQLKPHEKNYPAHDMRLKAVIVALNNRSHYLLGETVKSTPTTIV